MNKFEFKRLRIFRILGIIFLIISILLVIKFHNQPQQEQVFQIETTQVAKEELEDVENQNIPIPEDVQKQIDERLEQERLEQERLEQERIAQEQAEAEQKAKEEAEQKALEVAKQKSQVTSRGSTTSRETTTQATGTKAEYQSYARDLCINTYGWTEYDFECLVKLWNKESGWNANAHNSSSGAHGIPQSLPASKMASEGSDYYTNGKTQIRWGLKYIAGRYGTPSNAWSFWLSHNWY